MRAQERRFVTYDRGALSPTTELGVHDRYARAIGMSARQRRKHYKGILSRQRFLYCDRLVQKPKKTRPSKIRASQLGIRAKVYESPGTQCLVQESQLGVRT